MNEYAERPNLPGYVSIKEAAKLLGVSDKRVYEYVDEGRLPSTWAADVIMIPLHEVKKFKRRGSGRPRKNVPSWRISSGENKQFVTSIAVQIRPSQQQGLIQRLEEIRRSGQHTLSGTIGRFIVESETIPGQVDILFVWRRAVMPNEAEREKALAAFRQATLDVLDWDSAKYNHGKMLMHT
jgi:excisionase family DNA binding protein